MDCAVLSFDLLLPLKELTQKRDAQVTGQSRQEAFTLIEVVVSVAVLGILLVSLYGGLTFGFSQIQVTREEERATQILSEKMEIARLISWDQLVNLPGYIPTNFTASYSIANPTNIPAGSLIYSGTVTITNAPVSENYSNDLKMLVISLAWQSRGINHRRAMTTFVSRYGLQNYVY
jgi:prepilin-type N-terminal cleavage/methylation domain-containing protein